MNILWTGVLTSKVGVFNNELVSPAANNWQQQFINGLDSNGVKMTCITYLPNRYWPLGLLKPVLKETDHPDFVDSLQITYLNLPIIREFSLGYNLIKAIKKNRIKFDLLITYNPVRRNLMVGKFVKTKLKKKWGLIIADGSFSKDPDFAIFLSYNSYLQHLGKKYLMQGGTGTFQATDVKQNQKKTIVFSGTISELTGIVEFSCAFDKIRAKDIQLHIYGKGNYTSLSKLATRNENIFIHGFVDQKELDKALMEAWALVNPRNFLEETKLNTFPSKLLEYFRYGKPIISSPISSLTPEIQELLITYDPLVPISLTKTINVIESFSISDLIRIQQKQKEFCLNNSWEAKTRKFLDDIEKIIREE